MAGLFKYGPREIIKNHVHQAIPCLDLITSKHFKKDTLLRKLLIKLAQRLALCSMKVRIAAWRYQRGPRILLDHLSAENATTATQNVPILNDLKAASLPEEGDEISDEIEQVLGILIDHLRDKDTISRWMAAKGIGRICNRLNFDMADQVVSSIIEMLQEDIELEPGQQIKDVDVSITNSSTWHGACLALAELTRRGLLLPDRLYEAVPWVLRALTFEQRKGTYSLGTNVRDAACYVFWSVARAYEGHVISPFAQELAEALVVVSLTDREVSIRRAASAAFQENAGRHGLFPHGIDVITTADYFAIGNRANCFLNIALKLASYDAYRLPIINHLLAHSLSHWDLSIRHLTAKSLCLLAEKFPSDEFTAKSIPGLVIYNICIF